MSLKQIVSNYNITEDTTGIVIAIRGRYMILYPFWRMSKGVSKFSFYSHDRDILIHLGLFGIHLGTTKI